MWVIVTSAPMIVYGQEQWEGSVGWGSGVKEKSKGRAVMSLGDRCGISVCNCVLGLI